MFDFLFSQWNKRKNARLCVFVLAALLIFTSVPAMPVHAASSVKVTLPTFDVWINGMLVENDYRQYPLICYNNITYFPMTWHDCDFLGLESVWENGALSIKKHVSDGGYAPDLTTKKNAARGTATVAKFPVTANGKAIDNSKEIYPLLIFRDVTYFPLTWHFAVEEFGWQLRFGDETFGLTIDSDGQGLYPEGGLELPLASYDIETYAAADGYVYWEGADRWIYSTPFPRSKSSEANPICQIPEDKHYGMGRANLTMQSGHMYLGYRTGGASMGTSKQFRLSPKKVVEELPINTYDMGDFLLCLGRSQMGMAYNDNMSIRRSGETDFKKIGDPGITHVTAKAERFGDCIYTAASPDLNEAGGSGKYYLYKTNIKTGKSERLSGDVLGEMLKFYRDGEDIYYINDSVGNDSVKTLGFAEERDEFRVVGYYSGELFQDDTGLPATDKLTHLFYAFLAPKADGSFEPLLREDRLREITEQAHGDGVKVIIGVGGWSYNGVPLAPVFESIANDDAKRKLFISNIVQFVREFNLDGVELDWEHPNEGTYPIYERLVLELKQALDAEGKILTAAVSALYVFTDACLDSFEFINAMAYDMNSTDHSPLYFANDTINFWISRGLEPEKIVLGMPLYARPSWLQYRDLLRLDPQNAYRDFAETSPLVSYYNGINTLREKTWLALRKAGGVMLFDVNEDIYPDTDPKLGAVNMIHETLQRAANMTHEQIENHITIIVDGRELVFSADDGFGLPFFDENGRTQIPLRKTLESIGADVDYDRASREAVAVKDGTEVRVPIGEKAIYINGNATAIDTEAVVLGDRTYIPLRAVFSAFGYDVDWHGISKTIYLTAGQNGAGVNKTV